MSNDTRRPWATENAASKALRLRGRKVVLQDRPAGTTTWTSVASKSTSKGGDVSFKEPAPTVSEDYQLVFAGGPVFDGCQSGVVTATVTTVTP